MINRDSYAQFRLSKGSLSKFNFKVTNEKQLFDYINKTIYRTALSNQEKLDVLEVRDRVLKLVRHEILERSKQPSSLSAAEFEKIRTSLCMSGTCVDMCPERECLERALNKQLSVFELDEHGEVNYGLMVKEYTRSSADQDLPLVNELRTLSTLNRTMIYLLNEIVPKVDDAAANFPLSKWYDFIWSRSRSIRKDIVQQRLLFTELDDGVSGASLIESCARFHLFCAYRMCAFGTDVFDVRLNEETIKNCFQSLSHYYSLVSSPNEAEFYSYIILLNLNETNIVSLMQQWSKTVRKSSQVRFALSIYFAYRANNYVEFFRLVRSEKCTYLQACILHRYFDSIRVRAVKAIFVSYRDVYRTEGRFEKIVSLARLQDLLAFDDLEQTRMFLSSLSGLEIDENYAVMNATINENSTIKMESRLVQDKFDRTTSLSEMISNKKTFGIEWKRVNEETSFNSDGIYIAKDIVQYFDLAQLVCASSSSLTPEVEVVTRKARIVEFCDNDANNHNSDRECPSDEFSCGSNDGAKKRSRSKSPQPPDETVRQVKYTRVDMADAFNGLTRTIMYNPFHDNNNINTNTNNNNTGNNDDGNCNNKRLVTVSSRRQAPLTNPMLLLRANLLNAQYMKRLEKKEGGEQEQT